MLSSGSGTGNLAERVNARRLSVVRAVTGFAVVSNTAFAIVSAIADLAAYWRLIAALVLYSAAFAITRFVLRFGAVAAGTYLWIVACLANLTYTWLAGTELGSHHFLLAMPAIGVMVLGSERRLVALPYLAATLAIFFWIQFALPQHGKLVELTDVFAATAYAYSITMAALMNFSAAVYAFGQADTAEQALAQEHDRSERLLRNLMPDAIASRLKRNPSHIIADQFDMVTILFADIVDFTPRARRLSPSQLVQFLNTVFSGLDRLAEKHGLEKIKTVGDAYMVAGGMPEFRAGHATAVAEMALDILDLMRELSAKLGDEISVRIGIHTGPAVAGVIGTQKLFYDVWGDTVNTAARMESHGVKGKIQITAEAMAACGPNYLYELRGTVDVKGKGPMTLHYLAGRAADQIP